jgi:hypothetical protein
MRRIGRVKDDSSRQFEQALREPSGNWRWMTPDDRLNERSAAYQRDREDWSSIWRRRNGLVPHMACRAAGKNAALVAGWPRANPLAAAKTLT